MKNWKVLVVISTITMIVMMCLTSKEFNLEYILGGIIYRNENSLDDEIIFSRKSGFYGEEFYLNIYAPSDEIYYTLDGSEPMRGCQKYEEPLLIYDASQNENTNSMRTDVTGIFAKSDSRYVVPNDLIDKCTVIKVAYYDKNGQKSESEERVYFVGFEDKIGYNDVNIISITADSEDLFSSDRGIYVLGDSFEEYKKNNDYQNIKEYQWGANYKHGGREWERKANIQIFDTEKELVLSQSIGLRIQGGVSRAFYPKSLNIYARDEYGSNQLRYDFFGTGYYPQRVTLSAGGNDFYSKMRDRIGAELTENCNFSTMNYVPYVMFLNGEYWGFYYLTEKYDEHYIEHYYSVSKDNVLMIKQSDLEVGTLEDYKLYEKMVEFVESADMTIDENYEKACDIIDMDSFIDYYAAEIYMARNADWPRANFALWRSIEKSQRPYEDGKWRWMLFDVNTSALKSDLEKHDTLAYVLEECDLFASLSKNDNFRNAFAERLRKMRDELFELEKVEKKLAEYELLMSEPMENHMRRFCGSDNERYFIESREIWAFACLRGEQIEGMLQKNGF